MPIIEWNNTLSVHVGEFDKQHQKLIAMINELNDAMAVGKGKDTLGKIINGLVTYAADHFSAEEKYFDQFKYPDTLNHKKAHSAFVAKIKEFQEGFNKGSLSVTLEVMRFLKDWLLQHIQGTDKKYGPYLNGKGLS